MPYTHYLQMDDCIVLTMDVGSDHSAQVMARAYIRTTAKSYDLTQAELKAKCQLKAVRHPAEII